MAEKNGKRQESRTEGTTKRVELIPTFFLCVCVFLALVSVPSKKKRKMQIEKDVKSRSAYR